MTKKKSFEMTKTIRKASIAAMIVFGAVAFSGPAFAISSKDECMTAVKSATKDLLKANVKMDALGPIDAALIAAEAKCVSEDFAGAEADIANAKSLITASAQN